PLRRNHLDALRLNVRSCPTAAVKPRALLSRYLLQLSKQKPQGQVGGFGSFALLSFLASSKNLPLNSQQSYCFLLEIPCGLCGSSPGDVVAGYVVSENVSR